MALKGDIFFRKIPAAQDQGLGVGQHGVAACPDIRHLMLAVCIHRDKALAGGIGVQKMIKGGFQRPAFAEIDMVAQHLAAEFLLRPLKVRRIVLRAAVVDDQNMRKAPCFQILKQLHQLVVWVQRWNNHQNVVVYTLHAILSLYLERAPAPPGPR